jgi:hypothetical protein
VSKLHIAYGVVHVSARMVGILLNSSSQRQNSDDLHPSLSFAFSERRRREFRRAALGRSELLIEAIVPRRMLEVMSYKFRLGLGVDNELQGNQ